jgi:hypothetical protein
MGANYAPQLRRAWLHPEATLAAQSLSTWCAWPSCGSVAFAYGVFIVHDVVFLVVVGADLIGRFALVALIVRAHALAYGRTLRPSFGPVRAAYDRITSVQSELA